MSLNDRAVIQIQEFWNQCVIFAQEESEQAWAELERLEGILQLEHEKLGDVEKSLKEKSMKLSDIEERYNTLVENNNRVTKEKEDLASELTSLREQLSQEKKQGKLTNDKYDTYRHKLNETIREQGALFRRAQTYYQDTMDQLQKENERKTASSDAIDKAEKQPQDPRGDEEMHG